MARTIKEGQKVDDDSMVVRTSTGLVEVPHATAEQVTFAQKTWTDVTPPKNYSDRKLPTED